MPSRLALAALSFRLKPDVVIDCIPQFLPAAQIAFSCLNTDVPKQELYLFELASGLMAEPCAGPP